MYRRAALGAAKEVGRVEKEAVYLDSENSRCKTACLLVVCGLALWEEQYQWAVPLLLLPRRVCSLSRREALPRAQSLLLRLPGQRHTKERQVRQSTVCSGCLSGVNLPKSDSEAFARVWLILGLWERNNTQSLGLHTSSPLPCMQVQHCRLNTRLDGLGA